MVEFSEDDLDLATKEINTSLLDSPQKSLESKKLATILEEETVVSSTFDLDPFSKKGKAQLSLWSTNRNTLRINKRSESCEEALLSEVLQKEITTCDDSAESKPRI